MDSINNGGPAFPTDSGAGRFQPHDGMSLRAYFAAKALYAELVTAGALPGPRDALVRAAQEQGRSVEDQMAHNAVAMADALLKALSAHPKGQ